MRTISFLGVLLVGAILIGVFAHAQDGGRAPVPGDGGGPTGPEAAAGPNAADEAAAREPVVGIYRAVFDRDIEKLMAYIDFEELVLNGLYLGGEYQKATPTRRHDFRESVVNGLAIGGINKNQLLVVENSLQVRLDVTEKGYATVWFYNPAGRVTMGKVRRVNEAGAKPHWVLYSLTATN
ncbi:MAG: hypothetical protein HY719_14555 [Planctomycetes bacterium]|nr:hypothetical protein [Planctomycetota bacterium]